MSTLRTIFLFLILVALIVLYSSCFVVRQGQHALVLRLGELVKVPGTTNAKVYDPGFHWKAPFITSVREFDTRLQTLDGESKSVLTAEQKYVMVDYYVKWRISDLALFYKRTSGNAQQAKSLLTQKVNDQLRAAFGKRTIPQVVSGERSNVMTSIKDQANKSAEALGVSVSDVRIMAIDLKQSVQESVFQRMSAERKQVATQYRSQGKAQAETIRAQADAKVTVMLAKAKASAQQTRAQGDAQAANIYAKAYSKNPEFYSFYRSLEAYKSAFENKADVMVLDPKSQFFRYFDSLEKHRAHAG